MEQKGCSSCVKEPVGQINVARFIKKLDECFLTDDLSSAVECVEYWAREAEVLGDKRGLLSRRERTTRALSENERQG